MLEVTRTIVIPDAEFAWQFSRAGGPGGQHVNKTSSRAQLRWAVARTASLPDDVRARLMEQQAGRITTEGELLISSQVHRDQDSNRRECLQRLRAMILRALHPPKIRKATKPTRGSRKRRLAEKRHHSAAKKRRRTLED